MHLYTNCKDAPSKTGYRIVGYRLEFPTKLDFGRSTYPWQRGDAIGIFTFPEIMRNLGILFLELLMGREAHITVLSCTDIKQFLCERFREISV